MKRRLIVLTFLLIAFVWVAAEPQPASANNWPEDFGQCVDQFGGGWFDCWDTQWTAHDNCDAQYPPSIFPTQNAVCKNVANSARLTCTSGWSSTFSQCTGSIDYGFEEIDFCSNAIIAAAMCDGLTGEENLDAYYQCRSESQIHLCQ